MYRLYGAGQWRVPYLVAYEVVWKAFDKLLFINKGCNRDDEGYASAQTWVSRAAWCVPPGHEFPLCPVPEVWSPHKLKDQYGHKQYSGWWAELSWGWVFCIAMQSPCRSRISALLFGFIVLPRHRARALLCCALLPCVPGLRVSLLCQTKLNHKIINSLCWKGSSKCPNLW